MGLLDEAVRRQRDRRDPLARLSWPVRLLGLIGLIVLAGAQIALGSGASRLLGVALLVIVVPSQALATWATWKIGQQDRSGRS